MSQRAFLFGLAVIAILIFSLYRAKDGARDTVAEIERVEAEIAEAKALRVNLQAEFAHRSRQEWIEEYARQELGMIPPQGRQFITANDLEASVGPASEPIDVVPPAVEAPVDE